MAFTPIAKLERFTSKENDAQVWINNIAKAIIVNNWDDNRALQKFKLEFLKYFSNNNSINCLANTFNTIKQGDTEAIQAIDTNYFTAPQILNQFIYGLCSNILQHVCPLHPSAELEANHIQAINLVINESSELDSKLKQFSNSINQKLEGYLANNYTIYQLISNHLPTNDTTTNIPTTHISIFNLLTTATNNISTAVVTNNLSDTHSSNTAIKPSSNNTKNPRSWITQNWKLVMVVHQPIPSSSNQLLEPRFQSSGTEYAQNPNFQHYLSLLVTLKDTSPNYPKPNQQPLLTNNISPATILLFRGATLDTKLITTIYTDAKVDKHSIKLILDSGSAGSIITKQLMDQLGCQVDHAASACIITADEATKISISEIDDFLFEVNGIIILIKVLVIEEKDNKRKEKERKEENVLEEATNTNEINSGWTNSYSVHESLPQPPYISLKYKDCEKKLFSMKAWIVYSHNKNKIWHMTNAKVEGATSSEILEIKNNSSEPVDIVLIPNPEAFLDIETDPKKFYEHYQNLAPTRKKQKQHLEQLNTRLDNNESIMPKCAHDTDAEFDLRYPERDAIKLKPYLHTCIDLKIALEIPATTIIQLASRSSLVKKRINIREEIIDAGYVRNIIAMLQNNSEKDYIIEPNEKIA
ncbi:hypothetical protein G9A89_021298 [Geosiphon pyriformis]|nr:hypothetical protein G9A89_021298 [Geosiphon pyriformis]